MIMKTAQELLEKWIVVKFVNEVEEPIKVTARSNFEKMRLCDVYGNYGQKYDCYDAGCYSLENSSCTAENDCKSEISKLFQIAIDEINIIEDSNEFIIEPGDGEEYGFDETKVNDFIKTWREENENHIDVTGWTYWDSHNHKTVVLEADYENTDCKELNDDEQIKILSQMPQETPWIEGTNISEESDDYIFHFDRWATNPWFSVVEEK